MLAYKIIKVCMPYYKTHLIGGAVFFVLCLFFVIYCFSYTIPLPLAMQWLGCTLFGALFPDIDTKSKIQRFIYIVLFICLLFCAAANKFHFFAILSIMAMVPLIVNHRTLFHRPIFIIGLATGGALLLTTCYPTYQFLFISNALFFILGCFSHIFLDKGFKGFRI